MDPKDDLPFYLPFSDEPFDEEQARQQMLYLEENFDKWLESLRQ